MEQTPQQQQQQQDAATDSSLAARVAELTVQEEPEAAQEDDEEDEEDEDSAPVTISVRFTPWSNDALSRRHVLTYLRTWAELETDAPGPTQAEMAARLEQADAEGVGDEANEDEQPTVHFQRTSNVFRCKDRMQPDHELIWTGPVAHFALTSDPNSVAMRAIRREGIQVVFPSIERFVIQDPWGEMTVRTFG
jgi:hypothetical protein